MEQSSALIMASHKCTQPNVRLQLINEKARTQTTRQRRFQAALLVGDKLIRTLPQSDIYKDTILQRHHL